jgi:hypothetical protein
VLEVT